MIELNKEYTYPQICKTVGWEQKAGNSKKAQINEIESAYEFYHPENKKTHKPKKSYIFTKKIRDLIKPSNENSAGNNRKNIQPMIDYLQTKFDLDNEWYSFTDWYCEKLKLMYKQICIAVYHSDDIDEVCKRENISDDKLFCEYVSEAKYELRHMFLKSLEYLHKKNKAAYQDQYKFIYQLGERSKGYVITDCLNDLIKEVETTVCNHMNEKYNLSKKMKGRQLLKKIYSKENFINEFTARCLFALNNNDEALKELNLELSYQHETYYPDCGSICTERPLILYCRGISINYMELEEDNNTNALAIEITNRIRTKVRRTLRKHYRKFMKKSDLEAIEQILFCYYDENFDDGCLYLTGDNIADEENNFTDDNWGEAIDFSIEEILDMPTLSDI